MGFKMGFKPTFFLLVFCLAALAPCGCSVVESGTDPAATTEQPTEAQEQPTEAQERTDSVGDYPKTPVDAVVQYLELSCLSQNHSSEDTAGRIRELAGDSPWDIHGSPSDWYDALYQYQQGIELAGAASLRVHDTISGRSAKVTVILASAQKNEEITMNFDLAHDGIKWRISSVAGSVGTEAQAEVEVKSVSFSTYPIQRKIYSAGGGYADLDLLLPKLSGNYGGIGKINEYFAAKEQLFAGHIEDMGELPSEIKGRDDGFFRSAHYQLEAQIGNIISISAYLGGSAGGVGWGGTEGHVFDLDTGKKLGLSDIFKVGKNRYMDVIYDYISWEIAANIAKDGDDCGYLFDDPYYGEGYDMIRYFHDEKPDAFYLTDDSLVVLYEKYEIAWGAAGPQFFFIPFASIADILIDAIP